VKVSPPTSPPCDHTYHHAFAYSEETRLGRILSVHVECNRAVRGAGPRALYAGAAAPARRARRICRAQGRQGRGREPAAAGDGLTDDGFCAVIGVGGGGTEDYQAAPEKLAVVGWWGRVERKAGAGRYSGIWFSNLTLKPSARRGHKVEQNDCTREHSAPMLKKLNNDMITGAACGLVHAICSPGIFCVDRAATLRQIRQPGRVANLCRGWALGRGDSPPGVI
jgi:hypothetical protein